MHVIFLLGLFTAVCLLVILIYMESSGSTGRAEQSARSARLEELRRIQVELMERRRRIREQIKNENRKRKRLQAHDLGPWKGAGLCSLILKMKVRAN